MTLWDATKTLMEGGGGKGSLTCSNKHSILEYIPLLDLISTLVSETTKPYEMG